MRKFVDEWVRTLAGAALLTFVLKTLAFATYYIPSESMVPTLEVGDRLVATKFDFGYGPYSAPLLKLPSFPTDDGRLAGRLPTRGDIAIFRHPRHGETMIKRVIGLPGDRVRITGGQVFINDEPAQRRKVRTYAYRQFRGPPVTVTEYEETLPGGHPHRIILRSDDSTWENTGVYEVPPGHLFMMGDNRDNSTDSRFASMGYVPVENLLGRSRMVLFSLYECDAEPGLECAPRRLLTVTD